MRTLAVKVPKREMVVQSFTTDYMDECPRKCRVNHKYFLDALQLHKRYPQDIAATRSPLGTAIIDGYAC